jgi:hypothetical protein
MRKRRSDSLWAKLSPEQQEQMDEWFFEENLGHREIVERAGKEFGIKASQQTLTGYYRHRERLLNLADRAKGLEGAEEHGMPTRTGAELDWPELEAKVLRFAAMAAYEMSLAEPEKLPVKELRSLMRIINEHRRLLIRAFQ